MSSIVKWPKFAAFLDYLVQGRGLTYYRIGEETPVRATHLWHLKRGTKRPTDEVIKALAAYEPLRTTETTLLAWRALDEVPEMALREAIYLLDHCGYVWGEEDPPKTEATGG